jgi:hypothetical protein
MNIEAILTSCVVRKGNRDILVCAMQAADGGGRTSFHVLLGDKWFGYDAEPEWAASGLASALYPSADDIVVVAAAPDGRTWELNPASHAERLARLNDGDHAGITRLASIDNAIWACGMGRVVIRRDANGQWVDLSAPKNPVAQGITGFTGMAALPSGKQIAVGWSGEIWVRSKNAWLQEDSPTNSNLNNVSVGIDGEAVIVGDKGGLVVGKPGQWTALDCRPDFNLQGVCHFGADVFICSDFEIFRLVDGLLVRETRFEGSPPDTCMNLHAGDSMAYSQGERHIYRFDGVKWSNAL